VLDGWWRHGIMILLQGIHSKISPSPSVFITEDLHGQLF